MHHLVRLRGDGVGEVPVAVADAGGGDAAAEIEESSPVGRVQPGALAPLESEVGAVVCRHQGGDHIPLRSLAIPRLPARAHAARLRKGGRMSRAGRRSQTPARGIGASPTVIARVRRGPVPSSRHARPPPTEAMPARSRPGASVPLRRHAAPALIRVLDRRCERWARRPTRMRPPPPARRCARRCARWWRGWRPPARWTTPPLPPAGRAASGAPAGPAARLPRIWPPAAWPARMRAPPCPTIRRPNWPPPWRWRAAGGSARSAPPDAAADARRELGVLARAGFSQRGGGACAGHRRGDRRGPGGAAAPRLTGQALRGLPDFRCDIIDLQYEYQHGPVRACGLRLLTLLLAGGVSACASGGTGPNLAAASRQPGLSCAPFARALSGIALYGEADTWWWRGGGPV